MSDELGISNLDLAYALVSFIPKHSQRVEFGFSRSFAGITLKWKWLENEQQRNIRVEMTPWRIEELLRNGHFTRYIKNRAEKHQEELQRGQDD